jgi:NADPH-dependent ferric siderophore reductase
MVRLVFGGEGLDDFRAGEFSDHYVKLQLPSPGAPDGAPFDPERPPADLPRDLRPRTRHGEASAVRAVRRHLVVERGLPGQAQSISGYWKRRRTEEGWRVDKAEWSRQAEADTAGVLGVAEHTTNQTSTHRSGLGAR